MKKILFIISEDWYFVSHRANLAKFAINEGYEVSLLTRVSNHGEYITSLGVKIIDWPIERKSLNIIREFQSIYYLVKTVRKNKPNLLFAVAIKPVFYTVLSRFFINVNGIVLAFAGLGFIFRSDKKLARMIRLIIVSIFRIFLVNSNVRLIAQNKDDINILKNCKIIKSDSLRLIRGSGVNTNYYYPNKKLNKKPLVILPARMLWDKGVGDFVRCAQRCFDEKIDVRFALVGEPDLHNPERVPKKLLLEWKNSNFIEYWGRQENMLEIYNMSDIVCFPSYHEGLPKALLEAACCELPIVAYDVSGSREIVRDGVNGFLIELKNENDLFLAILKLLDSPSQRKKMGSIGRQIVIQNFADNIVCNKTIDVWKEFTS